MQMVRMQGFHHFSISLQKSGESRMTVLQVFLKNPLPGVGLLLTKYSEYSYKITLPYLIPYISCITHSYIVYLRLCFMSEPPYMNVDQNYNAFTFCSHRITKNGKNDHH